ncbi:MAG: DUF7487 domain-containing protein [Nitrosopumilaceae archaeon]
MNILQQLYTINVILPNGTVNSNVRKIFKKYPQIATELEIVTSFVERDLSFSFAERIYCIQHAITDAPICDCGNKVKFLTPARGGYKTFCTIQCAQKSTITKEKREKTIVSRFGVKNAYQSEIIKQKIRKINLIKYGAEHPAHSDICQQKRRTTNLLKYGTEHHWANKEIIAKSKQTWLNNYGTPILSHKHIPSKVLQLLNNSDWLKSQHYTLKRNQTEIAQLLCIPQPLVSVYFERHGIETTYFKVTTGHKEILEFINTIYTGEILVNTRSIIDNYEIDIYFPKEKLAIEYNGVYWHSENAGKDKHYHLNKLLKCQEKGIHLIQIFENEWITKQDIVKSRLSNLLNKQQRIYARKCLIKQLTNKESKEFLTNTHIQGYTSATINYGLMYDNEVVACMTFGKPRFNKNAEYEIVRFSNKLNTAVVGGASKLFKQFIKQYSPQSIISYSDKRWNKGDLYDKLGFSYINTSLISYYYFKLPNMTLYNRQKFQKHKLSTLLENFNPNLSEWENMKINGYNRIWDCGNDVWVWQNSH